MLITKQLHYEIHIKPDPRGESDSYLPFMFVAYNGDRIAWTEGLRKDGELLPEYEIPVRSFLKKAGYELP